MTNCHFSPADLGTFTLPQLLCLCSKHPATDRKIASVEQFRAVQEEITRANEEWSRK